MNQHQLSIEACHRSEIMERILRIVRHRGFQVHSMKMAAIVQTGNISIEIMVASQRPVNLLSTQLTKLTDVSSIEIQQYPLQKKAPGYSAQLSDSTYVT